MKLDRFERARLYVAKMPPALSGSGGHDQTFAVACVLLKGFDLTMDEARALMVEYNGRCQPPWSERELEHKLRSADKSADARKRGWLLGEVPPGREKLSGTRSSAPAPAPTPKPTFNLDKLKAFAGSWASTVNLEWLADRSAHDPASITPARFLELLYAPGERVLAFTDQRSQGEAVWPIQDLPHSGRDGVWFLAQPVTGEYYPNPRMGTMSRRSEEAVTAWRYLLIESDVAPFKEWLGALAQIPLRLVSICFSGARSLHALVRVDARTKREWESERNAIAPGLTILGADPCSMTAIRMPRLPGCMRGRNLQKLLYINPQPDLMPLVDRAPLRKAVEPWLRWASAGVAEGEDPKPLRMGLAYYATVNEACRRALAKV